MAFQFARVELFSRKGKDGRGTGFVFDEVSRKPSASMHVQAPCAPVVVYGLSPDALRALHDERAAVARQKIKGGKSRAVRQDQNTLVTLVLSHPATMEEFRASDAVRLDVEAWEARSVTWLRAQYGDKLASVVRHEDESHPHIHAYVLPDDSAMKAALLHPGFRAKAGVTSAGPGPGEDEKAHAKRANAAYQAAMRSWLDDYHLHVGQRSGLTRMGPGRRHLTRAAWHEEKRQAAALKETLERADALRATVQAQAREFVSKTKGQGAELLASAQAAAEKTREEAAQLRADAARRADAAKAAVDAAQAAEVRAREAAEKAQKEQQAAELATMSARRLSGLGGALRGLWDGLRRSKVADRIRAELAPVVEQWERVAKDAATRAAEANADRRELTEKLKEVRRSADVLGAQRDELRERLAVYEPRSPEFAPAAASPHL